MNVLSLFDGISCARVALERAGIKVNNYYSSEIDKYAIQIAQKNFPDTIQLGDIKEIKKFIKLGVASDNFGDYELKNIDLMIGGSPCQDLSIAKKNREGLKGCRSGLFYEFVRLIKEVKPKYFILENVNSMPKEAKAEITKQLWGIEPIMINAALVSAQNRKRLFWVGKLVGDKYKQVQIPQPKDRGIVLKNILEDSVDSKYTMNVSEKYGTKGLCDKNKKSKSMNASMFKGYENDGVSMIRIGQLNKGGQADRIYSPEGKSVNLSANGGGRGAKTGLYLINPKMQNYKKNYDKSTALTSSMWKEPPKIVNDQTEIIRKLTPIECERLQSLPDNYTEGVSNSQRYKMLGNGMNCEVIRHILSFIN